MPNVGFPVGFASRTGVFRADRLRRSRGVCGAHRSRRARVALQVSSMCSHTTMMLSPIFQPKLLIRRNTISAHYLIFYKFSFPQLTLTSAHCNFMFSFPTDSHPAPFSSPQSHHGARLRHAVGARDAHSSAQTAARGRTRRQVRRAQCRQGRRCGWYCCHWYVCHWHICH